MDDDDRRAVFQTAKTASMALPQDRHLYDAFKSRIYGGQCLEPTSTQDPACFDLRSLRSLLVFDFPFQACLVQQDGAAAGGDPSMRAYTDVKGVQSAKKCVEKLADGMFVGLDHLARALEIVTVVTRCKDSLPIYRTGPAWSAQLAMLKTLLESLEVELASRWAIDESLEAALEGEREAPHQSAKAKKKVKKSSLHPTKDALAELQTKQRLLDALQRLRNKENTSWHGMFEHYVAPIHIYEVAAAAATHTYRQNISTVRDPSVEARVLKEASRIALKHLQKRALLKEEPEIVELQQAFAGYLLNHVKHTRRHQVSHPDAEQLINIIWLWSTALPELLELLQLLCTRDAAAALEHLSKPAQHRDSGSPKATDKASRTANAKREENDDDDDGDLLSMSQSDYAEELSSSRCEAEIPLAACALDAETERLLARIFGTPLKPHADTVKRDGPAYTFGDVETWIPAGSVPFVGNAVSLSESDRVKELRKMQKLRDLRHHTQLGEDATTKFQERGGEECLKALDKVKTSLGYYNAVDPRVFYHFCSTVISAVRLLPDAFDHPRRRHLVLSKRFLELYAARSAAYTHASADIRPIRLPEHSFSWRCNIFANILMHIEYTANQLHVLAAREKNARAKLEAQETMRREAERHNAAHLTAKEVKSAVCALDEQIMHAAGELQQCSPKPESLAQELVRETAFPIAFDTLAKVLALLAALHNHNAGREARGEPMLGISDLDQSERWLQLETCAYWAEKLGISPEHEIWKAMLGAQERIIVTYSGQEYHTRARNFAAHPFPDVVRRGLTLIQPPTMDAWDRLLGLLDFDNYGLERRKGMLKPERSKRKLAYRKKRHTTAGPASRFDPSPFTTY